MNEAQKIYVARVATAEKGSYIARVPEVMLPEFPLGRRTCGNCTKLVVSFDYGPDVCWLREVAVHDPEIHGRRLPVFMLERAFGENDARTEAANQTPTKAMTAQFLQKIRLSYPDVRVVYSRLSLGGRRLFIRYSSDAGRVMPGSAAFELERVWGVSVNAWQLGPRDFAGFCGAIGPCGHECCCSTWQKRYPAPVKYPIGMNAIQANGICGRWKCCLAFEREG